VHENLRQKLLRRRNAHRTRLSWSDANICAKDTAAEGPIRLDRSELFADLCVPFAGDDEDGARGAHEEIRSREWRKRPARVTDDNDDRVRKVIVLL